MRHHWRLPLILCLTGVAALAITAYAIQKRTAPHIAARPDSVVVLELFTSEGCSSCPPADDLLSQIAREARESHSRVYPLAFHVDSWNQANWSDPFSSAEYTRREEAYLKAGISDGMYTPQMIVNGAKVAIGSDGPAVRALMSAAQQTSAPIELTLSVQRVADDLTASVDLSSASAGSSLNIAVVERGLVNSVPKGENAGRTLRHENVVRAYKTVEVGQSHATVNLAIPHNVVTGNCSVIAYVQNAKLTVLGATDVQLPASFPPAASQP
jgi:hypothetical protein